MILEKVTRKYGSTITDAISSLFILLFLYTAISKSIDIESTVNALKNTPYLKSYAYVISFLIVAIEYIVAFLLFFPKTRNIGLLIAASLMLIFTVYIISMKVILPELPCSCGGIISTLTWNQHLIFNVLFTLIATAGLIINYKNITRSIEGQTNSLQFETK